MSGLANFALFQLGWFASVLGAAHGYGWLGPLVVVVVVSCHLRFLATSGEVWLIAASTLLGTAVESTLAWSGVMGYASDALPTWLCPTWISAMWANVAITLRHTLGWLERRLLLGSVAGALLGPLAYVAGSRLGAIDLIEPLPAVAILAALWAFAIPALQLLSRTLPATPR